MNIHLIQKFISYQRLSQVVLDKMIPIRNSFAHGKSVIGKSEYLKESTDSTLLLQHFKIKKKGLDDTYKKFEILHFEVYLDFMNNLRAALVNLIVSFGMKAKDSNFQKTHDIFLKADT